MAKRGNPQLQDPETNPGVAFMRSKAGRALAAKQGKKNITERNQSAEGRAKSVEQMLAINQKLKARRQALYAEVDALEAAASEQDLSRCADLKPPNRSMLKRLRIYRDTLQALQN